MSDAEPPPAARAKRRSGARTRELLMEATITTLREHGVSGTSARSVAATAEVNQALIFYHFGDMVGLLGQACQQATEQRVAHYREEFATVGSLQELLEVGRRLHERERAEGNVAVLAQLLGAAQTDPALAGVTADALNLWVAEIEAVLARLFQGSPLAPVIDPAGLARAVAAAFVGLELYEGVDAAGAGSALDALDQLGALLNLAEQLGPLARRTVRSRVRKAAGK